MRGRSSGGRSPREASSDASLWEDLDDPNGTFAQIRTPLLAQSGSLPSTETDNRAQEGNPSNPITIVDSIEPSLQKGLELELFPSGREAESSSSSKLPQQPKPSASLGFDTAVMYDPWSQSSIKDTQYQRDEWLISVGQKQPDDIVEDHVAFGRSHSKASTSLLPPSPPRRAAGRFSRSNLLEQLNKICSPSSSLSGTGTKENGQQRSSQDSDSVIRSERPAILRNTGKGGTSKEERPPFRPVNDSQTNAEASSLSSSVEENTRADAHSICCSPPSQPLQRVTMIADLPPEKQELYHRLAFGTRSPTDVSNVGTTVRSRNGKTWQTTWQNDGDEADVEQGYGGIGAASTSRDIPNSRSSGTRGSGRGAKGSKNNTGARKAGPRSGKSRATGKSSSSINRSRSRFFAAKNGRRGRGRGR